MVVKVPEDLRVRYSDWSWDLVYENELGTLTYRLYKDEVSHFLKVASRGVQPSLSAEAARLAWAKDHLPVPRVVECDSGLHTEWLVVEGVPGRDAMDASWSEDPHFVVRALARGLREFHAAPIASCPFNFSLDEALGHAHRRLAAGEIDPGRDFHPEFKRMSAAEALDVLECTRPEGEDLVVCHGDYCLPNVILDSEGAVGFVDLGELGVADRWSDLAVATWSIGWNLGPGYDAEFYAEYGVPRDAERIAYYRLLYDVIS